MSPADVLSLRGVEQLRGLERVWEMFDPADGGLTKEQYGTLRDMYDRLHQQIESAEQPAEVATEAEDFERELLSFVLGRLLRAESTRQGAPDVGAVADGLLAELAERAGVATPPPTGVEFAPGGAGGTGGSGGETWSPRIALVRLRFPGAGFWDLPVLAHEFFHYLLGGAPAVDLGPVGRLRGVRTLLAADLGDRSEQYAEELMADIFATYALGPAYPSCCIALRAGLGGRGEDATHPPWHCRIAAMLRTLDGTAERYGFAREALRRLTTLWTSSPDAPDARGAPPNPVDQAAIGRHVHAVTRELDQVGALGYHADWQVNLLAAELDHPPAPDAEYHPSTTDVLNATWFWRLSLHRPKADVDRATAYYLRRCPGRPGQKE